MAARSGIVRVAGICGSLRKESFNKKLLEYAKRVQPADVQIEIIPWGDLPILNQDLETNLPEAVVAFKKAVSACDAVLFVTPEYNYSIPGGLKNAIDWGSRPYGTSVWDNKAVAIMGASPGKYPGASGTGRAQLHLRQTFVFLNMHPVQQPEVMVTAAAEMFDADGKLTNDFISDKIKQQLSALADMARRMKKE
eukprot:TRINITY_DN14773_c0_g1_i1.p1 TRINITY_DN14773_c0_g1~~TRINITY_DN14773_c0_g1_i1.p1  ORF type:complete len:194 (-),score=52.76 TRINITY_DN14773_c0_g1_i1:99-680(-)